jgi:T4 RnlA family RNA ligase
MQVIQFIKEKGFQALTDELGIVVKFVDDLVVLNYNQIESPRTNPITMECRSLILHRDTLKVVSRSFDRFFNLGEALNVMPTIDWSRAEIFEKVDGSLIKIYNHCGVWKVATRGTAYAESDCMGHGITFAELVYKAIGAEDAEHFDYIMQRSHLHPTVTYIFELTSVENRVVKHYSGYNLHFLAARDNVSGVYMYEREWLQDKDCYLHNRIKFAKRYNFTSEADAVDSAAQLKDLDEGYIVYMDGVPVCKIKSPAYVAVHHLKSEGLNPKRISQLVLSGEEEEYLTYFPEDRPVIEPYATAYADLMTEMLNEYGKVVTIKDQKEFALAVAKYKYKGVLFNSRQKGIDVIESFRQQRDTFKVDLLRSYVK